MLSRARGLETVVVADVDADADANETGNYCDFYNIRSMRMRDWNLNWRDEKELDCACIFLILFCFFLFIYFNAGFLGSGSRVRSRESANIESNNWRLARCWQNDMRHVFDCLSWLLCHACVLTDLAFGKKNLFDQRKSCFIWKSRFRSNCII